MTGSRTFDSGIGGSPPGKPVVADSDAGTKCSSQQGTVNNIKCKNCGRVGLVKLYRIRKRDGSFAFSWVCDCCNSHDPGKTGRTFVPKKTVMANLTREQVGQLPHLNLCPDHACERCGNPEAQLHHWAPKGLFGLDEAEEWPTGWLCIGCHTAWHEKVTPQLVARRAA